MKPVAHAAAVLASCLEKGEMQQSSVGERQSQKQRRRDPYWEEPGRHLFFLLISCVPTLKYEWFSDFSLSSKSCWKRFQLRHFYRIHYQNILNFPAEMESLTEKNRCEIRKFVFLWGKSSDTEWWNQNCKSLSITVSQFKDICCSSKHQGRSYIIHCYSWD